MKELVINTFKLNPKKAIYENLNISEKEMDKILKHANDILDKTMNITNPSEIVNVIVNKLHKIKNEKIRFGVFITLTAGRIKYITEEVL